MSHYNPPYSRVTDTDTLVKFVSENAFGTLVTLETPKVVNEDDGDFRPLASQLIFYVEDASAEQNETVLLGHMSAGNSQWRSFTPKQKVLVLFQEPHAYISPSVYDTPHNQVPTWDYATVQARGFVEIVSDSDEKMTAMRKLVTINEDARSAATGCDVWDMTANSEPKYLATQLRGIVVFRIKVTEMIGRFKLNQNRSAADQVGVKAELQSTCPHLAQYMGGDEIVK
eukprot:TRINITY_DN7069_c0_g1_i1.p1 TRINITY_DN7069_c0_g1~~TRINITY_DN7069_c0_g1_i1.p1  ORF type:complete len:227 (-),score=29.95 TRINITY_DN7069_c0_g1_i1:155-835(-)